MVLIFKKEKEWEKVKLKKNTKTFFPHSLQSMSFSYYKYINLLKKFNIYNKYTKKI